MKKLLCIALALISLYANSSIAMEEEPYNGKKKAEALADSFFEKINALDILEEDWKKGGNMAQFYPLNRINDFYGSNMLSAALRKKKSAAFVGYLVESGADVLIEWESDWGPYSWKQYCLPIALASFYGDPDTVAMIIKLGGISNIMKNLYWSNQGLAAYTDCHETVSCSLLIRYMREAKECRNTIANYVTCLEYLIKGGCCIQQKNSTGLDVAAYVDFGGSAYDLYYTLSHKFTTPLMEAIRLGVPEFVDLFLRYGADPDKKYDGKSARDIAQEKSLFQKGISLLLKKNKKNILARAEEQQKAKREADEARVLEAERQRQEEATFKEEKRLLGSSRILEYVTIHKNLAELPFLSQLKRDKSDV